MHEVDIRPGVVIAYEDDWFGKPWTVPQTVVMIHGNCESSRAWTPWVAHLAGQYRIIRLDLPGFGASTAPPGYGSRQYTECGLPQLSPAKVDFHHPVFVKLLSPTAP